MTSVVFSRPGLCFSDLGCVFETSVVFFQTSVVFSSARLCFSDLGCVFETSAVFLKPRLCF